jgi:hypothetical protein
MSGFIIARQSPKAWRAVFLRELSDVRTRIHCHSAHLLSEGDEIGVRHHDLADCDGCHKKTLGRRRPFADTDDARHVICLDREPVRIKS